MTWRGGSYSKRRSYGDSWEGYYPAMRPATKDELPDVQEKLIAVKQTAEKIALDFVLRDQCLERGVVASCSSSEYYQTGLFAAIVSRLGHTLMSDTSQVPFQHDELVKVLDFMPHVETGVGRPCAHFMAVIARVNRRFCAYYRPSIQPTSPHHADDLELEAQSKFFNFCGKEADRVDGYLSIDKRNSIDRKTIFYRILNLILFGAPEMRTRRLEKIWAVKMGGSAPCWKNYINRRNGEWNSLTIYISVLMFWAGQSTVLLAVNVSFLALPGVETKSTKVLSF
ncbi:hypothetical protein BJ138DRAFT_1184638, partial [Hygrophoropsis aurantiaca]